MTMKPTIIFLHGGPGFTDYLEPYFSDLKSEFNCVFYNQKQGSNITVDALVSELDKIVENSESKPILLGHSWGGVLALKYASRNQSKLSGLILMSTGLSAFQWVKYRKELEDRGLSDAPPEEIFLTASEREIGKPFMDKMWANFSDETFDSIFETYLKKYNLLDSLSLIEVPILNVFGKEDLRFSLSVTQSFKKYNEKIVDVEINNAGHFPFLLRSNREDIFTAINNQF